MAVLLQERLHLVVLKCLVQPWEALLRTRRVVPLVVPLPEWPRRVRELPGVGMLAVLVAALVGWWVSFGLVGASGLVLVWACFGWEVAGTAFRGVQAVCRR